MTHEPASSRFSLANVAERAKEIALQGEHLPTVIAQGKEAAVVGQMPEFPPTPGERIQYMYVAGYLLGKQEIMETLEEVFVVFEAWMSVRRQEEAFDPPPSEDPEALEILLISALSVASEEIYVLIFEIVREAGKRVALKEFPLKPDESKEVESPLLEAFVLGFAAGKANRLNLHTPT